MFLALLNLVRLLSKEVRFDVKVQPLGPLFPVNTYSHDNSTISVSFNGRSVGNSNSTRFSEALDGPDLTHVGTDVLGWSGIDYRLGSGVRGCASKVRSSCCSVRRPGHLHIRIVNVGVLLVRFLRSISYLRVLPTVLLRVAFLQGPGALVRRYCVGLSRALVSASGVTSVSTLPRRLPLLDSLPL